MTTIEPTTSSAPAWLNLSAAIPADVLDRAEAARAEVEAFLTVAGPVGERYRRALAELEKASETVSREALALVPASVNDIEAAVGEVLHVVTGEAELWALGEVVKAMFDQEQPWREVLGEGVE